MEIIRTNRKSLAIIIKSDGTLLIRSPLKTPISYIEDFIKRKHLWIEAKTKEVLSHPHLQIQMRNFIDGEEFLYLGKKYFLKIGEYKEISLNNNDSTINFPKKFLKNPKKKIIEWYYKEALSAITELCSIRSAQTGWKYKSIKIINARTKWGSCNSKDELRFNWKLIMASTEVIDYVVVHELAHIPEKNHSSEFWNRVESILPDYKGIKNWLKENGHTLNI